MDWCCRLQQVDVADPVLAAIFQVAASNNANAMEVRPRAAVATRWQSWLEEGPARGLKRQHRLSRCAVGWFPDVSGESESIHIDDRDELSATQARSLRHLGDHHDESTLQPLGAQQVAEHLEQAMGGRC